MSAGIASESLLRAQVPAVGGSPLTCGDLNGTIGEEQPLTSADFRKRFTASELERLYVIGFFDDETDRYELIDGDLIEMARMQAPHAATTNRLNSRLSAGLGTRALVIVQNPVILAGDLESVPQPDLTVAKYRKDGYAKGHPRSESVFLVIEVMETSHRYDRGVKLPKYAATGIPETWLVDLPGQRVEVYRNPADGVYLERTFVRPGESISPTAFPEVILPVSEILGLFDGDESEHEGVHES